MCQICRCGSKIEAQLWSRWEARWFAASGFSYLHVKCSSSHLASLNQTLLLFFRHSKQLKVNHLVSRLPEIPLFQLVFVFSLSNQPSACFLYVSLTLLTLCLAADCFTCDLIALWTQSRHFEPRWRGSISVAFQPLMMQECIDPQMKSNAAEAPAQYDILDPATSVPASCMHSTLTTYNLKKHTSLMSKKTVQLLLVLLCIIKSFALFWIEELTLQEGSTKLPHPVEYFIGLQSKITHNAASSLLGCEALHT